MSPCATSRRFAVTHQPGRFRSEADIDRARRLRCLRHLRPNPALPVAADQRVSDCPMRRSVGCRPPVRVTMVRSHVARRRCGHSLEPVAHAAAEATEAAAPEAAEAPTAAPGRIAGTPGTHINLTNELARDRLRSLFHGQPRSSLQTFRLQRSSVGSLTTGIAGGHAIPRIRCPCRRRRWLLSTK